MAITIGQFLGLRSNKPDTFADPYDPKKESLLELLQPEVPFSPSSPAALPPPPGVGLSSPAVLPAPPNVALSSPSALPVEPAPPQSVPAVLPPEPAPPLSIPSALPPPPGVVLSSPNPLPPEPAPPASVPAVLPAPPSVVLSSPAALPAEPAPPPSVAAALPPPPATTKSIPAILPPAPATTKSIPAALPVEPPPPNLPAAILPAPPDVKLSLRAEHLAVPVGAVRAEDSNPNPRTHYSILGERYSPIIGPADPGSLATDPFMYERSLERMTSLPPGKLILHGLVQVGMFAQNVHGTIWNPAVLNPPPILQNMIRPALDLPPEGTEKQQIQIGSLVDKAMKGASIQNAPPDPLSRLTSGVNKIGTQVSLARLKRNLAASFDLAKTSILANGAAAAAGGQPEDRLIATAFTNGIIPMRLKGDNALGFRTFTAGGGDKTDDDDVYMPLCFTDLRPVNTVYRTVYFRPLDLQVAESFSPQWNKAQYYGRVDPVATYQSTGRAINLSFKLHAFGPEDVITIYQKLNWLVSMVYPEYDGNMQYKSGPVCRMRVGDLINATGPEKSKGLPGIIESLDFDYNDALWELKKDFKLPRSVAVSLTFTVLHDVPIGRGVEGKFGGLGKIDENGKYTIGPVSKTDSSKSTPAVYNKFRKFGPDNSVLSYDTLAEVDAKKS